MLDCWTPGHTTALLTARTSIQRYVRADEETPHVGLLHEVADKDAFFNPVTKVAMLEMQQTSQSQPGMLSDDPTGRYVARH